MSSLVYLLLGLSCLGLCVWLWRRKSLMHAPAQGALKAAMVALLLVASTSLLLALAGWGLSNSGLAHAQRIMGLAAQHIAPFLLGLAALYLGRGMSWKPNYWASVILGIMAFYELSRYLEWQTTYQWLVSLLGALALLATALLYLAHDRRISLLCLVAPVCLVLPALLNSELPQFALLQASLQASWLLPGYLAAGLAVGLLAEQAHNNHSTSHDRT